MLRLASIVLALTATAFSQVNSQYAEITDANLASAVALSKPLVIAVGVRSGGRNTEMDQALFMVAQSTHDLKIWRAEAADTRSLIAALDLKQFPAYVFINPSCDKVVVSVGLMDQAALNAFIAQGKQACSAADNPQLTSYSRRHLLDLLGVPDKTVTGFGVEYVIDKPLAGIVVGAPDEGEKLMRPVVVSAEKPLTIAGVAQGSPADLAGIHPGDRITAIAGATVDGATYEQIAQRIHGAGNQLSVSIAAKDGHGFTVTLRAAEYLPVYSKR